MLFCFFESLMFLNNKVKSNIIQSSIGKLKIKKELVDFWLDISYMNLSEKYGFKNI